MIEIKIDGPLNVVLQNDKIQRVWFVWLFWGGRDARLLASK